MTCSNFWDAFAMRTIPRTYARGIGRWRTSSGTRCSAAWRLSSKIVCKRQFVWLEEAATGFYSHLRGLEEWICVWSVQLCNFIGCSFLGHGHQMCAPLHVAAMTR